MRIQNFSVLFFVIAFLFSSKGYADELLLQPDSTAGKDACIASILPDENFENFGDLTINYGGQSTSHGMIEFDISSLPPNVIIDSVTLELLENANCSFNQNLIEIHLNSASWDESTVTWNNAPSYGPSITTNSGETADCDVLVFDVTTAVRDWYNNTSPNYGFRITGPSEANVIKYINSSDRPNAADRPILRINYTSAQSQPIPTLSEWGMIIMLLVLAGSAIWMMRRRQVS